MQNNILRSPGYPSNFSNNLDCVNKVNIALNKGLLIAFNYFSLESHPRCRWVLGTTYCVNRCCHWMKYKSAFQYILIKMLLEPFCMDLLWPMKLLIYHKFWQWKVLLLLKLLLFCCLCFFSLLSLSHRWDYLRITADSSKTIGTYCGNQTGKSVRVFGTFAVLTFHTDGSVRDRGFELSFSFFPRSLSKFSTRLSSSFSVLMFLVTLPRV